ncbi:MAG TPA: 4Fe-4S binding protein [Anaerolineales bacterium]|nr:4Fe-4S binding protein [Anaerolineales bacterium]HRF46916.1 4Fe-4S binding protein [Anaerolineales bacterium]
MNLLQRLFGPRLEPNSYGAPAPDALVTPDPTRCVQCGICGFNCPVGIPVRDYACRGRIVDDLRCVQCGKCVEVCPRGTLRWTRPVSGLEAIDPAEAVRLLAEFAEDAS